MIENSSTFKNKEEMWQVKNFDLYEDKFLCENEYGEKRKFTEKEVLEGEQ